MSDETLGFNEDLERDIVALSLSDVNFFLDIHEYVKPSHFADKKAARAWATVKTYFDSEHTLPKVSMVTHMLGKMGVEATKEYFVPDGLHRDYLLEETLTLIRDQEFKKLLLDGIAEVDKNGKANYEGFQERIKDIVSIQRTSDLGLDGFDLDETFERLKNANSIRYKTGITSIDRVLGGGVANKELMCIAAPPGVGKSILLMIMGASFVQQGLNVLHYSFEMSEERTILRYYNHYLNMNNEEIFEDVEKVKSNLRLKKGAMDGKLRVKEFPTSTASVNTLRSHMNKLKEQDSFVPDVIICDYGDIMKATRTYNSRYEEQGAVFQELRGLGQELNVPMITATQTTRGSMTQELSGMDSLADSFDKARIMDNLFIINQKPEEKDDGLFRLYTAKNRNGAAGQVFGYNIIYERMQLEEVGELTDED